MRTTDFPALITIDGRKFVLADAALRGEAMPRMEIIEAPSQRTESIETELRIYNEGSGWGHTVADGPGQYAVAMAATLHTRAIYRPGVTWMTAPLPVQPLANSRGSFCEYSTRLSPDRRLLLVTARHIYEIDSSSVINAVDMGPDFTLSRGMSKAVAFANEVTGGTYVYVARPSVNAADAMVERTPAGVWQVSPNGKYAEAIGAGKDAVGMDVLWRVDANGRLNQAVAGYHPSAPGTWQLEAASAPIGPTIAFTNDILQIGRQLVIARSDGFVTFDSLANAVPITRGHEQAQHPYAGQWLRDLNGSIVAPSGFGLIQIMGTEWSVIGPVSANHLQRELYGRECATTSMVGSSIYCAVFDGSVSYIFHGTPKRETDLSAGPLTWHGPISFLPGEVTDLAISTVGANRLWAYVTGPTPALYYTSLDANFDPVPSAPSGTIELPDGLLDGSSPNLVKDLRKVEYTYPVDFPYDAAANDWVFEVWDPVTSTWVPPDLHTGSNPQSRSGWYTSQRRFHRTRGRLRYTTNNPAACGLESVTLRMIERPERTRLFKVNVRLGATATARYVAERTKDDDVAFLRERLNGGRAVTVSLDQRREFQAVLVSMTQTLITRGDNYAVHLATLELYEVGLDGQDP